MALRGSWSWVSSVQAGREGWWFHLVVPTGPQGSTGTNWERLPGPQLLLTSLAHITALTAYSSIKYLRDKLSVCTSQLFTSWTLIFIIFSFIFRANQNPDSAIFSLNHKGSSRSPFQLIHWLKWQDFYKELPENSLYGMTFVGPFVVCLFFKQLLSSVAQSKPFLGQTAPAAESRKGFAAGGFDAASKKLLLSSGPAHPQHSNLGTSTLLLTFISPPTGTGSSKGWI